MIVVGVCRSKWLVMERAVRQASQNHSASRSSHCDLLLNITQFPLGGVQLFTRGPHSSEDLFQGKSGFIQS